MKHTPGPWYQTKHAEYIYIQSSKINEDNYVCGIEYQFDQDKHNANLIAAAPDLLEACQRVSNALEDGNALDRQDSLEDMHDILQNAIKNAKGE